MDSVFRLTDITVEEVSLVDKPANNWPFLVMKNDMATVEEVAPGVYATKDVVVDTEKAVCTTAYVDTLPDSAFLHIKPGGQKDAEGKTVPRSLRMFPVHNEKGVLDLPQDLKDRLQATTRRLLAENTEKVMSYAEMAKTTGDVVIDKMELLKQVSAVASKLSAVMSGLCDSSEGVPTELRCSIGEAIDQLCAGAKFDTTVKTEECSQTDTEAPDQVEETKSDDASEATVEETPADVADTQEKGDTTQEESSATAESDDQTKVIADLQANMAQMTQELDTQKANNSTLLKSIDKLVATIEKKRTAKSTTQKSNAVTIEEPTTKNAADFWPSDMAKAVEAGEI
jgi:hypothetical protein